MNKSKRKRILSASYTGFQPSPPTIKKFEYCHYDCKLSKSDLNEIGSKGWELVSHTALAAYNAFSQYYVFKREKINKL